MAMFVMNANVHYPKLAEPSV